MLLTDSVVWNALLKSISLILFLRLFIMRLHNQVMPMGKIHNSVQEMLAEARQIVSTSFSLPKGQSSHLEVYLPPTKINQHLREMLKSPSGNYKKIERNQRYTSSTLQNYNQNPLKQHSNLMMRLKSPSPKQQEMLKNRYALDSIMTRSQDQILNKRNKRLLCDKKTINLLPELPDISIKYHSKEIPIKESFSQEITQNLTPRCYLTITQKDTHDLPSENCNQANQDNQIKINKNSKNKKMQTKELCQLRKKFKSQLMKNLKHQSTHLKKQKPQLGLNGQTFDSIMDGLQYPEPWISDVRKDQYFDLDNF